MAISPALLGEFEYEFANTRKSIERVPDNKFGWKPHSKSSSMGDLAIHLTEIPGWAIGTLMQDSIDVSPVGGKPYEKPNLKDRKEILDAFDKNVVGVRAAIPGVTDEQWMKPWSLLRAGQPIFTMPRIAVFRGFIMNHNVHHRAQLGVYLRLNDIAVPAIYGPSADEGQM